MVYHLCRHSSKLICSSAVISNGWACLLRQDELCHRFQFGRNIAESPLLTIIPQNPRIFSISTCIYICSESERKFDPRILFVSSPRASPTPSKTCEIQQRHRAGKAIICMKPHTNGSQSPVKINIVNLRSVIAFDFTIISCRAELYSALKAATHLTI